MASETRRIHELRAANKRTVLRMRAEVEDQRRQFVFTELDTAITFCEVALSTENPEKKARNINNALVGYQTALRFWSMPAELDDDERFQRKIATLRQLLDQLGQNPPKAK